MLLALFLAWLSLAEAVESDIFVAGLPRTGSTSVRQAIARLGHLPLDGIPEMFLAFQSGVRGGQGPGVCKLSRSSREELRRGRGVSGCNKTGNDSGLKFRAEATHMNLKVVLTQRSKPETWVASIRKLVIAHSDVFNAQSFSFFAAFKELLPFFDEIVMWLSSNATAEPKLGPEQMALAYYTKYNEFVASAVPKKNLLVFNVQQGWAPLCEFLEVASCPIEQTFPWVNAPLQMQLLPWEEYALRAWPFFLCLVALTMCATYSHCCLSAHHPAEISGNMAACPGYANWCKSGVEESHTIMERNCQQKLSKDHRTVEQGMVASGSAAELKMKDLSELGPIGEQRETGSSDVCDPDNCPSVGEDGMDFTGFLHPV